MKLAAALALAAGAALVVREVVGPFSRWFFGIGG